MQLVCRRTLPSAGKACDNFLYSCSLHASQAALKGAVALCKRHSRDAAPQIAEELWFGVLQSYVTLLRDVRRRQRAADEPPAADVGDLHRERLLLAQVSCIRRYSGRLLWCRCQQSRAVFDKRAVRCFVHTCSVLLATSRAPSGACIFRYG